MYKIWKNPVLHGSSAILWLRIFHVKCKTVVFMCSLHCLMWEYQKTPEIRHFPSGFAWGFTIRGAQGMHLTSKINCKLPADLTDQHRCHKLRFSWFCFPRRALANCNSHVCKMTSWKFGMLCFVPYSPPVNGAHIYFLNCSVLLGTVSSPYLHLWMHWFRMAKPCQTFSQKILLSEPVSRTAMFRSNFCAAVRLSEAEVWQERIARMGFLEDVDSRQVVFNN